MRILTILIKKLGIPVTRQSIVDELEKHPDTGSLRAISDTLDTWSIPNVSYSATFEELIDTEIPLPFIACFVKGEFVLITQINETQIIVSNDSGNEQRLTLGEFKKRYKGTILAFEKDTNSGESNYPAKRRKEIVESLRIPFIVSGLVIMLILFLLLNQSYINAFNWHIGFLTFFKIAGLLTSILLLTQSLDVNNPIIKRLCGGDDNQNCNSILSSKAAKITEELSWSEVGFFYFTGTWLVLLFNSSNDSLIRLLAIINLLCLPYTFYSIYYQWRVAKQWCIFCCTIQSLLWLEFFAFMPYLSGGIRLPDLYEYSKLLISMLVPILLWVFLKPHLMSSKQLKLLKSELYRFKYNKELFQNMLHKENKYVLPAEEDSIIIGNREAEHVITLVSNPFCVHCSKAHKFLDALLEVRDDIKLQLVFIGRMRERETDKRVMGHFMSLELDKNEMKLRTAINDWYKQNEKDYEVWKEKYPVKEIAIGSKMLSKQKEWCNMVNITGTPTLFINGRRLPSAYQPEDIQFLV